jgi:sulfur-oxidizing protein SoxZ
VSRNPFLHFRFGGGKPGEKVAISWVDNRGDKRTDEAVIAGG